MRVLRGCEWTAEKQGWLLVRFDAGFWKVCFVGVSVAVSGLWASSCCIGHSMASESIYS